MAEMTDNFIERVIWDEVDKYLNRVEKTNKFL